jgi:hypothetical protein
MHTMDLQKTQQKYSPGLPHLVSDDSTCALCFVAFVAIWPRGPYFLPTTRENIEYTESDSPLVGPIIPITTPGCASVTNFKSGEGLMKEASAIDYK